MNIKSALKQKNKLISQIKDDLEKLNLYNSVEVGQERPYDPVELQRSWLDKTNQLIDLKVKIHKANVPVFDKIFRMSELKTIAKGLKSLDCTNGKKKNIYNRSEASEFEASIGIKERDTILAAIESDIEGIQEQLDHFNAITII